MPALERFKKMPVGVLLIFLFTLLGLPGVIMNVFQFPQITFSNPETAVFALFFIALGIVFLLLQLYGLFAGKKFLPKIYLVMIAVVILQFFVASAFFPLYYSDIVNYSISAQAAAQQFSTAEKQVIEGIAIATAQIVIFISAIIYAAFFFYARRKKEYFAN